MSSRSGRRTAYEVIGLCLAASSLFAQPGGRLDLGRLDTGATVSFVRSGADGWGIEITEGPAPRILQPRPVRLELQRPQGDTRQLAAGYGTVRRSAAGVDA